MVKKMEKYKKFWETVDIEYTEKEGKRKANIIQKSYWRNTE